MGAKKSEKLVTDGSLKFGKPKKEATHDYALQRIPLGLWWKLERNARLNSQSVRAYILGVLTDYVDGSQQDRVAMREQLERAKAAIEWALKKV